MYSIDENRFKLEYSQLALNELLNLSLTVSGILRNGKDIPFNEPQDFNEFLIYRIVTLHREQKTEERAIRYLDRFVNDFIHPPCFGSHIDKRYKLYELLFVPTEKEKES